MPMRREVAGEVGMIRIVQLEHAFGIVRELFLIQRLVGKHHHGQCVAGGRGALIAFDDLI